MISTDQDILNKMEEMMTRMTAPIIERLHHLEKAQGKKKKAIKEPQDEDLSLMMIFLRKKRLRSIRDLTRENSQRKPKR